MSISRNRSVVAFFLASACGLVFAPASVGGRQCRGAEGPSDAQVIAVMRKAAVFYREKVALEGGYVYYYSPDLSERLGDFLCLAQMPAPQPAWAQQYNYYMRPIWARAFEPPGISGDESQEVIETLMKIYVATGDGKYLEPIPRAIAYLERSLLPDGRLARYYELETNRPLYMVRSGKQYRLTTDDSDLPKHYGWKTESRLDALKRACGALASGRTAVGEATPDLGSETRRSVESLDLEGRWVSICDNEPLVGQPKCQPNEPYISSAVFSRNMAILSEYLTRD